MAGLREAEVDSGTSVTCGRGNGREAWMGVLDSEGATQSRHANTGKRRQNLVLTSNTASVHGLQVENSISY